MKAGIIGLGHGSRVLIDSFKLSKVKIEGIASKNFINAKKIGQQKKIPIVFKNWKTLVRSSTIDIVAIAVPALYQYEILKECIKYKKIILCEKPILIKKIHIKKLFFSLSKYDQPFFVDYIFPEHKAFLKFKKILDSKKKYPLDLIEIEFKTQTYANKYNIINWKSQKKMGGGIINLFLSHITDYLILFFGKIRNIKCEVVKIDNIEQNLFCNIVFKSGIKAKIIIDTNSSKKFHLIKYLSKDYQLNLINKGNDYTKKFKIFLTHLKKNNKKSIEEVYYKDKVNNYSKDSRILLFSRIINKTKKKMNKKDLKSYLNRYKYNEMILEKCRICAKNYKIKAND